MHCSRLVWNRTAEINFGLRPNFGGLRLKSQTKLFVWDSSLRPKLSVTLLFALIRSQTGFLVSDQGLKLWFQRKIKWPNVTFSKLTQVEWLWFQPEDPSGFYVHRTLEFASGIHSVSYKQMNTHNCLKQTQPCKPDYVLQNTGYQVQASLAKM